MINELNLSFKNWFNALSEAYQTELIDHPKYGGTNFQLFVVHGVPDNLDEEMKDLGFKYNPEEKSYFMMRKSIYPIKTKLKNKNHEKGLFFGFEDFVQDERWKNETSKIGINTRPIGGIEAKPVASPNIKAATSPKITTKTASEEAIKYYLATSKSLKNVAQGDPLVVYLDKNNWIYQDRKGNSGTIPSSEIGDKIKRYTDKDGNSVSGSNIKELFQMFDRMSKIKEPESIKDKGITSDDESGQLKPKKAGGLGVGRPAPQDVRIPAKNMTEYNTEIQNKFNDTKENIMIDALAGTGKTTMLKHLSSFIKPGEKWLYLVFNKKNQIESNRAFPSGVDVLTTHSFLGNVLKENGREVGGETQLPPEGQKWRKIWKIADRIISSDWPSIDGEYNYKNKKTGEMTSPFHYKAKRFTTKLVDMAKAYAVNPNEGNCQDKLMKIINDTGMETDVSTDRILQDRDYTPDMVEKAMEIMKLTMPLALNDRREEMANYRDQDDTLWYAALNADKIRWNPFKYDVVLLDEVQDFNECQLIMAQKLKEAGCRIIGVGDKFQGMYAFRGAYSQAFEKLKSIIGSGKALTLPVNFRSGGKIIDWVRNNTHVDSIKAAPHLEGKGEVYAENGTHPPIGYNNFLNMVTEEFNKNDMAKESTAFICRSNAPLGNAALHFLKNNIDFQIIGKDLSKDLIELIKKSTKNKPEYVRIEDYRDELEDYVKDQEDRYSGKISKSDELASLREFAGVLNSVHQYLESKQFKETEESSPITNVKEFQSYLERKLGGLDPDNPNDAAKIKSRDARKVVTLTTAHKSKGLEWERTFIMKPAGFNPEKPNIKTEEQKEQEKNAWYVAVTRGRNTLMISSDDEPK